jgi:DNA polymerase III subunit epsilon
MRFLAIDFETADDDRSSACAIGLVLTDGAHVLGQHYAKFKPAAQQSKHTNVHGIALEVSPDKDFVAHWPEVEVLMAKADALMAHDAPHVKDLLERLMSRAKLKAPEKPFVCTQKLSKHTWQLSSNKLKDVAEHFAISVDSENALSRALGCARVLGRAISAEARIEDGVINHMRLPIVFMSPKVEPLVPHEIVAADRPARVSTPAMAWVIAAVGSLLLLAVP